MKKLSIVIVNFNTWRLLQNCIDSVIKYAGNLDFEIIIVDNASTEELKTKNHARLPARQELGIELIKNKKNVGFAAANNQGIKLAKGEYILLLNPDTIIGERTLSGMVDFMEENQGAGAATCKVQLESGKLDDACHRGFPTPWNALCHFFGLGSLFSNSKFFNGYHLGYENLDKIHQIDACAGAFMLVRRKAGEQVNWLDEDYFWYGEDLDFCYRLGEKGWKVMYVPEFSITHYKGVSAGIKKHSQHLSTADRETKLRATKARFEVMRIFYKKHYMKKYSSFLTFLVLAGIKLAELLNLAKYTDRL